jgi:hypothetical protein
MQAPDTILEGKKPPNGDNLQSFILSFSLAWRVQAFCSTKVVDSFIPRQMPHQFRTMVFVFKWKVNAVEKSRLSCQK